jgi:hypothetical protein
MALEVKPLQATAGFRGLCLEAYMTLERTIVAVNRPVERCFVFGSSSYEVRQRLRADGCEHTRYVWELAIEDGISI